MLTLGSGFNYYFCAEPVTLRYRHKGLRHYIKSQLHRDPTNGDVYIFLSRGCKRIRLYYYHHQGEILSEKILNASHFVEPVFDETTQQSELCKMLVDMFRSYGITKDKTMFYNGPKIEIEHTDDAGIFQLDVWQKGCPFGDVNIGDDKEKLRSVLGEPDTADNTQWQYVLDGDIIFTFRFKGGIISHMSYQWPQS